MSKEVIREIPERAEPDWLDEECVRLCALEADEGIGLDEVRQALSKIPSCMTNDFVAEREDR